MTRTRTAYLAHVVRHGESEWNRLHRIQGQSLLAGSLTESGRSDALRAAEVVAERSNAVSLVMSSDLPRAVESAAIVAAHLHVTVAIDPAWREIALGALEGRSADDPWEGASVGQFVQEMWAAPERTAPGGESLAMVAERALAAFVALGRHVDDGGAVVVVSHGGLIRTLLAHAIDGGIAAATRRAVPNGAVWTFAVEIDDGVVDLSLARE
jgi:probable phosphoglycerate mutase